jgi:hypothetical protein
MMSIYDYPLCYRRSYFYSMDFVVALFNLKIINEEPFGWEHDISLTANKTECLWRQVP